MRWQQLSGPRGAQLLPRRLSARPICRLSHPCLDTTGRGLERGPVAAGAPGPPEGRRRPRGGIRMDWGKSDPTGDTQDLEGRGRGGA